MRPAKLFKNNQSQAVRLPKALELPAHVTEVEITALGAARLIAPIGSSWDDFFDGPGVSDDFLDAREQPEAQERGASFM